MRKLVGKGSSELLWSFIALFMLGFFLLNPILIYASLIPLLTMFFGLIFDQPRNVKVERFVSKHSLTVGGVLEVSIKISVQDGIGKIIVYDDLPECFEVVEGSNRMVVWKGFRREFKMSFSYKVKCLKRGSYILPATKWVSEHPLGLKESIWGDGKNSIRISVYLNLSTLEIFKSRYAVNLPLPPTIKASRIGHPSTDFKDIREYVFGDSVKSINWKATARRLLTVLDLPLVNEYEREGKETVWIFLNASKDLESSSGFKDMFGHLVTATASIAFYYLNKNCRIGMYIYNGGKQVIQPFYSKRRICDLVRKLSNLETYSEVEGLDNAVKRCKLFLCKHTPLSIIVTSLYKESHESFLNGLRDILTAVREAKRKPLITVVNVQPYGTLAREGFYERNAATLLWLRESKLSYAIRNLGVRIIDWDPADQKIGNVVFGGIRC